jgi:hypothetical protein
VLGRLEKGGGEPHDRQEDEPEQGQGEGDAFGRPEYQGDGGAGLDEHRGADDEAGEAGVGREYSAKPSRPTLPKSG